MSGVTLEKTQGQMPGSEEKRSLRQRINDGINWGWKRILRIPNVLLFFVPILLGVVAQGLAALWNPGLPQLTKSLIGPAASLMTAKVVVFSWMANSSHPISPYPNRDLLKLHNAFFLSLGCSIGGIYNELVGTPYFTMACVGVQLLLLGKMCYENYCVDRAISETLEEYLVSELKEPLDQRDMERVSQLITAHFEKIAAKAMVGIPVNTAAKQADALRDVLGISFQDEAFAEAKGSLLWLTVGSKCVMDNPSPQEREELSLLAYAHRLCEGLLEAGRRGQSPDVMQMALCVSVGIVSSLSRWVHHIAAKESLPVTVQYHACVQLFFDGLADLANMPSAPDPAEPERMAATALFLWLLSDYAAKSVHSIVEINAVIHGAPIEQTLLEVTLGEQLFLQGQDGIRGKALTRCESVFSKWDKGETPESSNFECPPDELLALALKSASHTASVRYSFSKENVARRALSVIEEARDKEKPKPQARFYV